MKNQLILFFLILYSATTVAQKAESQTDQQETFNYNLIEDEPLNFSNVSISFIPLFAHMNGDDLIALGGGVKARYRHKENFMLFGEVKIAYLDRINFNDQEADNRTLPANGSKPHSEIEIGGTKFLFSREKIKETRVHLESGLDAFDNQKTYYTEIETKVHYLSGLEIAVTQMSNIYNLLYDDNETKVKNVNFPEENTTIDNLVSNGNLFTQENALIAKLGYSWLKIRNSKGEFDEYGEKTVKLTTKYKVNLLYGFSSSLDNLIVIQTGSAPGYSDEIITYYKEFELNNYLKYRPLGFELGFEQVSLVKSWPVSLFINLGISPGYHSSILYDFFGEIGYQISFGKKNKIKVL